MQTVRQKRNQPWSPKNPSSLLARRLHESVQSNLIRLNGGDYCEIQVFTSIGSPLDYKHKVDGFVVAKFKGDDLEPESIITFDLTVDPRKTYTKAHLILRPEHFIRRALGCDAGLILARCLLGEKQ